MFERTENFCDYLRIFYFLFLQREQFDLALGNAAGHQGSLKEMEDLKHNDYNIIRFSLITENGKERSRTRLVKKKNQITTG